MDTGAPVPSAPPSGPAATRTGKLSPTAAYGGAWSALKRQFWLTIGVTLALFGINTVGSCIPFLGVLFGLLVTPALMAGLAGFMLRTVRGERPAFSTAFEGFERWPSVTGAMLIVYGVVILIGVPMIVVLVGSIGVAALLNPAGLAARGNEALPPGLWLAIGPAVLLTYPVLIWWTARTLMVVYAVMEPDRPGALTAFKRTWALTRGNVWRMVGLYLLSIPVTLLGFLALCVGMLPAVSLIYLAFTHAYEQMRARGA